MLERYLRIKSKGKTPSIALVGNSVIISYNKYDEESGDSIQINEEMSLPALVSDAIHYKRLWLAAKDIYETLKGEPFPN